MQRLAHLGTAVALAASLAVLTGCETSQDAINDTIDISVDSNITVESGGTFSVVGEAASSRRLISLMVWEIEGVDTGGRDGSSGGFSMDFASDAICEFPVGDEGNVSFVDRQSCGVTIETGRTLDEQRATLRLTVIDANGKTKSDSVSVRVLPTSPELEDTISIEVPPVDAVTGGGTFFLEGSAESIRSPIQQMHWSVDGVNLTGVDAQIGEFEVHLGDSAVCEFPDGDADNPPLVDRQSCGTTVGVDRVFDEQTVVFRLTVINASGKTESLTVPVRVTPMDFAELRADAGEDRIVGEQQDRHCTATGGFYFDANNPTPSFRWTNVNADEIVDAGRVINYTTHSDTGLLTVELPEGPFDVIMRCTVTDQAGNTDSDDVLFRVPDKPPLRIETEGLRTVEPGDFVTLSASVSNAEDDEVYYAWNQVSGFPIELIGGGRTPEFIAPQLDNELLIFEVRASRDPITDDTLFAESAIGTVGIQVAQEAGWSVEVVVQPDDIVPGDTVRMGANIRTEVSGDFTFSWSQVAGPTVTLFGTTTAAVEFVAPAVDDGIELEVVVTRERFLEGSPVTDTRTATGIAFIGDDFELNDVFFTPEGSGGDLSVDVTNDSGLPLSYVWEVEPEVPGVSIQGATTASPSITFDGVPFGTDVTFVVTVSRTIGGETQSVSGAVTARVGVN